MLGGKIISVRLCALGFNYVPTEELLDKERGSVDNMKIRTGLGYDVHKLVEGRELWLGGIRLDYELGLLGHITSSSCTTSTLPSST